MTGNTFSFAQDWLHITISVPEYAEAHKFSRPEKENQEFKKSLLSFTMLKMCLFLQFRGLYPCKHNLQHQDVLFTHSDN